MEAFLKLVKAVLEFTKMMLLLGVGDYRRCDQLRI